MIKNIKICNKIITILIYLNFIYFINYEGFSLINFGKMEFDRIEYYLKKCKSNNLINKKMFKKRIDPKVSIISPVYNREKYLLRFLKSIQYQKFNDLEIIFIDDFSKDNSVKIIEESQKRDKRILLIKNKKNRGTFISRNIGVLNSKGKYLILPDPDDIISKNIIDLSYNIATKYNYEMIRFNIYIGNEKIFFENIVNKLESRPIYQPELSTYLFYGLGYLEQIDFNISNKFIKRLSYIRALNYLNNYYLNIYMIIFEDGLMNYILYRTVKSFYYLKKIGYFYIKNEESITNNNLPYKLLKYIFIQLKIIFEYSKNTKYEKNMANCLLERLLFKYEVDNKIKNLTYDFNFYYDIINKYLQSKFIKYENKIYLKELKKIILNNQKNTIQKKL